MPTQQQYDAIPDVSEQTKLDNGPVKIRWSGRDRSRVRRGLLAALEDGYVERAVAYPVVVRQKTQIVIKTEEELEAFTAELETKAKWRTVKRLKRRIKEERRDDDGGTGDSLSEKAHHRKEETDMDTLLQEVVIPHARSRVEAVWPGGTVDVDDIYWFWNPQLSDSAGMAYRDSACPRRYVPTDYRLAIGLAKAYYYKHGVDELLEVVRHELIHVWQYEHKMGSGGHGSDFKQWLGDMDTHRHCKHW
jgi:hypothetical protein